MANVKVFAVKQMDKWTNGQIDKMKGQKLYAPNLSMLGHKKTENQRIYLAAVQCNCPHDSQCHQWKQPLSSCQMG